LLAACTPALTPGETHEGISSAVQTAYLDLKAIEAQFPVPTPSQTVLMGTMDASTGVYTATVPRSFWITGPTGKPVAIHPSIPCSAVDCVLRWNITNRGASGVFASVNGVSVSAPIGQPYVEASAFMATSASWSLHAGGHGISDAQGIARPEMLGVGAFTIPVLPVSIVYEPPQDSAHLNSASITLSQQYTTIQKVSSSSSSSTSSSPDARFDTIAGFESAVGDVASILHAGSFAWDPADKIGTALDGLPKVLGSISTTDTQGTTATTTHTLEVTDTSTLSTVTEAHIGPGQGDVFVYYNDVKLAWVYNNGTITLTLLGHGALTVTPVENLLNDLSSALHGGATLSGLDAPTLQSLLNLDPFTSGGTLPANRFGFFQTYNPIGPASVGESLSETITTTDESASSSVSTEVVDSSSGWLSAIGLGVTSDGTTTTSLTTGSAGTTSASSAVAATLTLHAAAGESYSMDVYYDRIFGTFAFKPTPVVIFPGTY
jgi:hypothetical protein